MDRQREYSNVAKQAVVSVLAIRLLTGLVPRTRDT